MIEWIPRLIVLLIAILIIALVVRSYTQRDVEAGPVHIAAYLARLERDENLYLWTDPSTGRATPGVVDAAKLVPGALDQFSTATGTISSKVQVNGSCIAPYEDTHDRVLYDRFFALATQEVKGAGGAMLHRQSLPVTIIKGDERCAGMMTITVVRPNKPSGVAS